MRKDFITGRPQANVVRLAAFESRITPPRRKRATGTPAASGLRWYCRSQLFKPDPILPHSFGCFQPFFKPFLNDENGAYYPGYRGAQLLAAPGDPTAIAQARLLTTFAKVLGEGMPSLSFAAGRNQCNLFGSLRNLDLNIGYDSSHHSGFKNSWPKSRGKSTWTHSDFINPAYNYVFPLYDTIVNKGVLK